MLDAWSKRNHPNMHFMFFEDMKKVIKEFLTVEGTINLSLSFIDSNRIYEARSSKWPRSSINRQLMSNWTR
jgi:hypothetical protein